jgi:hypothetical protein
MAESRGRISGCVARRGPRLPRRSCATPLTLRSKFPPQSDRQADDCSACLSKNPDFMRLSKAMLHSCCRTGTSRARIICRLNPQRVVAQLRRGNRGPRRATQPLALPRLSAISAPCTSACRVQKRRGVGPDCDLGRRQPRASSRSRPSAPSVRQQRGSNRNGLTEPNHQRRRACTSCCRWKDSDEGSTAGLRKAGMPEE